MTKDELISELKQKDTILPRDILKDADIQQLSAELTKIFRDDRSELETDGRFRQNYTELINYVYLVTLEKTVESRNKNIFSESLIAFLLDSNPAAA